MSKSERKTSEAQWLDLSPAAEYLGVHYTTLRRWADRGKIPCARTPGGRRRFYRHDLDSFLRQLRGDSAAAEPQTPSEEDARVMLSQDIRLRAREGDHGWLEQFNDAQRMRFRHSGRLMLGLLMQYNSRPQGGEIYVQEAEKVMREYGLTFQQQGFSLAETARAFLFFRRSIMDMIFHTGALEEAPDREGWRLYRRTNEFLDMLLLAVLEGYNSPSNPS